MSSLTTFNLPISGMTCTSCAGRVERALAKVADVACLLYTSPSPRDTR